MTLSPGVHKLRKFLETHKIPQLQAARALGVTHVAVLQWIRGRATPTPPLRKAIEVWTSGEISEADWETSKDRRLAEKVAAVKPFEPEAGASDPDAPPSSEPSPKGEPHAGAAE